MTATHHVPTSRSRWVAIGAAVAVTFGAGSIGLANAQSSGAEHAVYEPIAPCRLLDTRAAQPVPGHKNPIAANSVLVIDVDDAVGNCAGLPDATGLSLNVTSVAPTAATFLALVPGVLVAPTEGTYQGSSNLNPAPGQPPAPNAVNVDLDADGQFSIYNAFGTVDVIVDVVGYYRGHDHDDRYPSHAVLDDALATKADRADTYSAAEVDGALAAKADGTDTYTKAQVDAAIAAAVTAPAAAAPTVQAEGANQTISSTTGVEVVSVDIALPESCAGAVHSVLLTASGYTHYYTTPSDAIDAALDLEVDGATIAAAHLEVQIQAGSTVSGDTSGLFPEIPFARTVLVELTPGDHTVSLLAAAEYAGTISFNVRESVLVAQPVGVTCAS